MNNVDRSFVDYIGEAYIAGTILESFGSVIDHMVESTIERVGLFESKEDREQKAKLSGKPLPIDIDDSLFDDGLMIDELI